MSQGVKHSAKKSLPAELSTSPSFQTAEYYGRSPRAHETCKFSDSVPLASSHCRCCFDELTFLHSFPDAAFGQHVRILVLGWRMLYRFSP